MQALMFNVTKFTPCEATGFVDLEYVFDIGDGPVVGKYPMIHDRALAEHHIKTAKCDYISRVYERWVNHKKKLSDTGTREFYNTISRLNSLEKCIRGIKYIAEMSGKTNLQEICRVIPIIEKDLRNILPAPGNPSYNSSIVKLDAMISFCRKNGKQQ